MKPLNSLKHVLVCTCRGEFSWNFKIGTSWGWYPGNLRTPTPQMPSYFEERASLMRRFLRDNDGLHNPLIRRCISWGRGVRGRISTCIRCFLRFITYRWCCTTLGISEKPYASWGLSHTMHMSNENKIPDYLVFFLRIILPSYTCREYFINPLILDPVIDPSSISWFQ